MLLGEIFSAGEGEVGMRGFVHDKASEGDGVFDGGEAGNSAASSLGAVHDGCLHFHRSLFSQGGSTP